MIPHSVSFVGLVCTILVLTAGLFAPASAAETAAATRDRAGLVPNAGASGAAAQPPLAVVLKFDDLREVDGVMPTGWERLAHYLRRTGIKGAIGIVADSLLQPTPAYLHWIKAQHAAGLIEFWFHGWDHLSYTSDGMRYNEFVRPYRDQASRVARSQHLARQKLGFDFSTFGPPGGPGKGSFNADTLRLMVRDPDLRVMLYPTRLDAAGRAAVATAAGKLTILERVHGVDLESPIGVPNFDNVRRGIEQHPERGYFILQGHPARWDTTQFSEFERIVDYLIARRAVFMTPTELAAALRRLHVPRTAISDAAAPD